MRQRMKLGLATVGLALLPIAILAGCSLKSVSSIFPVANQHPASWVNDHGRAVQAAGGADKAKVDNGMTCNVCHTATLSADKTVASSQGANSTCYTCHAGGPSGSPHVIDWTDTHGKKVVQAGGYTKATFDSKSCAVCHTTIKAEDGTIPKSPDAVSTCYTCHVGGPTGTPHTGDWVHAHGKAVMEGGGYQQAKVNDQSCNVCHTAEKAADGSIPESPKAESTCYSCHLGPNGPS